MNKILETMIDSLSIEQLQEMKAHIETVMRVKSGSLRMLPGEIAVCKSVSTDGYNRRIEAIKLVRARLNLDLRSAKEIVDEECPR